MTPLPSFYRPLWRTGGVALFVMGFTSNIMILVVVWRLRSKSPSYLFILALAVSDIFMNFSTIPSILYGYTEVWHWHLNVFTCKTTVWLIHSCRMTSAWLTAAISVYRAVEVKRPNLSNLRKPRRVNAIIITIWLVVYALNSFYIHIHQWSLVKGEWRCTSLPGDQASDSSSIFTNYGFYRSIFYLLGSLLLPFVAMIISDIILIREVYKSSRQMVATGSQQRTFTQITVLVLAISLSFFVFNGPALICANIAYYEHVLFSKEGLLTFSEISYSVDFLAFIRSAIDFFIYVFVGGEIRKMTTRMITCDWTSTFETYISPPASSSVTAAPSRVTRLTFSFCRFRSVRKIAGNPPTEIGPATPQDGAAANTDSCSVNVKPSAIPEVRVSQTESPNVKDLSTDDYRQFSP